MLAKAGMDFNILDSGCCGMAGSFGFERDHYEVSQAVGELVLLPAVREAAKDTLVIADGFSCREQIEQLTPRRALHLAQVLQMALQDGPHGPAGDYPESKYDQPQPASLQKGGGVSMPLIVAGAGVLLGGWVLWKLLRRRSTPANSTVPSTTRPEPRSLHPSLG